MNSKLYCLDTNIFIEAWTKYYSPEFAATYWDLLRDLGRSGILCTTQEVFDELGKDELKEWVKDSGIAIRSPSANVGQALKDIYAKDATHKYLVNNITGRSKADPWVIAHAIDCGAAVVTKELFSHATKDGRIRIPDVCKNMGIECIDDFQMIRQLGIHFNCITK